MTRAEFAREMEEVRAIEEKLASDAARGVAVKAKVANSKARARARDEQFAARKAHQ